MTKTKFPLLILITLIAIPLFGQDFLDGAHSFSRKKPVYLTTTNGKEYTGEIVKLELKKGLIEEIKLKIDGKKVDFKPEEVQKLYAAPSNFDYMVRGMDFAKDATKWDDDHSAHASFIKDGYVFFEPTEVIIKKKTQVLLLQLLNPGFANGIKIYQDPRAGQTASVGVGPLTVAGGETKSYFVKKGNTKAFKLAKKNFDENEKKLFGDCPAIFTKYGSDLSWFDLEKIVFMYSEECSR